MAIGNNRKSLFKRIKRKKIKTWFDLGIFLDKLQQRRISFAQKPKDFQKFSSFSKYLSNGSFAFITYDLGVDGVSTETSYYIRAFRRIFPRSFKASLIVGDFNDEAEVLERERGKIPVYKIQEAAGFEKWGDPYQFLYFHKLKRGGRVYNLLPALIWKQSLTIIEKMLNIIEKENIRCLVLSNVASNPGNLSLTLATVIVSEILGMPVVNINHDFYWEGGKNPSDRQKGEQPGMRDHFFTNVDLGEFFSIIKLLFPWRSQFWMQVNISKLQSKILIEEEGLNPNNVTEIGTAIDTKRFNSLTFLQKEKVYYKLNLLFGSLYKKLVVYKPGDYQINHQAKEEKPFVIGWRKKVKFSPTSTLLFLQPTRIIERKQIEKNFLVLKNLFENKEFKKHLHQKNKKVLLLITGPIASGHFEYFQKIKREIVNCYQQLTPDLKKRLFVGFKFGKDSNENFLTEGLKELGIDELYGIADLVFLLSQTEGRGLPIIESAAAGVPLVVNPFSPYQTYKEVTSGLKVFAFRDDVHNLVRELMPFIISKEKRKQLLKVNRKVVNARFTFKALEEQFVYILEKLWQQTGNNGQTRKIVYQSLRKVLNFRKNSIKEIVAGRNRTYFPGYIPCGFLFYLKSLIDPSFFRIEQLDLKSRIFAFGRQLVDQVELEPKKRWLFFKAIEEVFYLIWGKEKIIIDHSLNYRNRTSSKYLFHQLTEQELRGVVVCLSQKIFGGQFDPFSQSGAKEEDFNYQPGGSWSEKLKFLFPNIDSFNVDLFYNKVIKQPREVMFFLGDSKDVMVDLKILTEELITERLKKGNQFKFSLVVNNKPFLNGVTKNDLEIILKKSSFRLLRQYRRKGILRILSLSAYCHGTNFYQLNKKVKNILVAIKERHGVVFARGEDNFVTLDLLDIDSFRFGRVDSLEFAHFIGLTKDKTFFQFVPAGLRPVLNYPVPTQQIKDFNQELKRVRGMNRQFWEEIKNRQDETGEDLRESINNFQKIDISQKGLVWGKFSGKHSDGLAWTGAYFKLAGGGRFEIIESRKEGDEALPQLVKKIEKQEKKKVLLGFNGGFILNNELVGKLGLTEEYIGTPLGLAIHKGKILSLPLYNRPVLAFKKNGEVLIKRLSLPAGKIWVEEYGKQSVVSWDRRQINPTLEELVGKKVAVYNLMFDQKVSLKNRVLVTICGRKIAAVYKSRFKKAFNPKRILLPVGITLSFSREIYDNFFAQFYQVGKEVDFTLELQGEWKEVEEAVGAGPLLIKNGKLDIDMKLEGFKTKHSIKSQASRNDRLNQRGPKIALGLGKENEIIGVVFNSRIRDSFGVTYEEMANVLLNMGAFEAMAFDPGGAASLYIKGKIINIPPYNADYNRKIYYAVSQPRGIGNAVVFRQRRTGIAGVVGS
ncbi:MAG: phosphodiester glycosidase family protein, partial [Patescibacteria group bacterium]